MSRVKKFVHSFNKIRRHASNSDVLSTKENLYIQTRTLRTSQERHNRHAEMYSNRSFQHYTECTQQFHQKLDTRVIMYKQNSTKRRSNKTMQGSCKDDACVASDLQRLLCTDGKLQIAHVTRHTNRCCGQQLCRMQNQVFLQTQTSLPPTRSLRHNLNVMKRRQGLHGPTNTGRGDSIQ